jgi:hypothetical protein
METILNKTYYPLRDETKQLKICFNPNYLEKRQSDKVYIGNCDCVICEEINYPLYTFKNKFNDMYGIFKNKFNHEYQYFIGIYRDINGWIKLFGFNIEPSIKFSYTPKPYGWNDTMKLSISEFKKLNKLK